MNFNATSDPNNKYNLLKVNYVPPEGHPTPLFPKTTLTNPTPNNATKNSRALINKKSRTAYGPSGATNHLNNNRFKDLHPQKIDPPTDPTWFPTYDEFLANAKEAGVNVPDLRNGNGESKTTMTTTTNGRETGTGRN